MIPGHVRWEGRYAAKVDGDVAIGDSDSAVRTATVVVVGFSPEECATTGSVVELELEVVVAISGNGTSARFQTGLEVQVVGGGGIRGLHAQVPAREEKQGEEEQGKHQGNCGEAKYLAKGEASGGFSRHKGSERELLVTRDS